MVMTCIFYSPLIPQAIPLALVSIFFNYWVTKYMLLRKYKMPEMFSSLMATFFANLMPWLVLLWAISAYFFFISLSQKTRVVTDDILENKALTLLAAILSILFPFRILINRSVNSSQALNVEDEKRTYSNLALTFSSDYDRENPLTVKKGTLRLIELQMKQAQETGDESQIEALRQQ